MRFLEGYHPEGFAKLPALYREQDRKVEWSREQAEFGAWLVQWHFAHQANARVLLSRMRLLDKAFLCRTLHPAPAENNRRLSSRLLTSLCRRFRVNLQPMLIALCQTELFAGYTVLLAGRRGHPSRPQEIDYRVEAQPFRGLIFLPRNQRLRSLGLGGCGGLGRAPGRR